MALSTANHDSSDCPICLGELSFSEQTYSLPCQTCDFTYCSDCIHAFVRSSRDDYQVASDGSRQVKVHVACPQCRSKYPMDISKILLLRQVHALGMGAFNSDGNAFDDSNLNASQLSGRRDFRTRKKQRQVQLAHGLYLKVMGDRVEHAKMVEAENVCSRLFDALPVSAVDSIEEDDDEYLDNPSSPRRPRISVDISLFQGLHDFLGWDEKVFLTELFTSGDEGKLVQAAMILNGVLKLSMQPPSKRPQIYEDRSRVNYKKAYDILEGTKKAFPLAMHMPGYFLVQTFSPRGQQYLSFRDKTWDGTITPPSQSKNFFSHVYGDHYHPPKAENNPRPIVIIDDVRGPAGRVGLRKGDIVTHVNEVEWTGTAKELIDHVHKLNGQNNDEKMSITVNATPEAATFLKVRKELMEKSSIEVL